MCAATFILHVSSSSPRADINPEHPRRTQSRAEDLIMATPHSFESNVSRIKGVFSWIVYMKTCSAAIHDSNSETLGLN